MTTTTAQIGESLKAMANRIDGCVDPPKLTVEHLRDASHIVFLVAMALRAHRLSGTFAEETLRTGVFIDDLTSLVCRFVGVEGKDSWPSIIEGVAK